MLGSFWGLYAPALGQKTDSAQSYLDWQLALLRLLRSDSIKCHFYVGSEPLWAWVWLIFDR